MPTTIAIIEDCAIIQKEDGYVCYTAKAAIDGDGCGPSHGDPDFQANTSLHVGGHPLNADVDRYIVVPPAIIMGVAPVVLGCRALVTYRGKQVEAVVGDIGPRHKLGEMSIAMARELGIPWSPTTGGIEEHAVVYELFPGVAAPGYELQAA